MSLRSMFSRNTAALGILLAAATLLPAKAFAQALGDYRSAASGNWNATATWERYDGSNWVAAVATPTSADGAITIRNGHTVTISASGLSYDQVTVDAGGQVTVASTVTSTLANGTGTDLVINGTWLNQGGTWTTTGTWSVGAGGTFIHNTTSGIATPLGASTLDAASTFIYRGSSTLTPAISTSARTYGNLTFESTSGSWTAAPNGAGALTINGSLAIGSGVTVTTTQTGTMTIAGNLTNNGTLTNSTGTQVYTFTGSGKSISGNSISFETLNINSGASVTFASPMTLAATFTTTVTGTAIAAATITNSGTMSITGTLQLDPGGSITGNAPTYSGSGTLVYNRTATVGTEWGSGGSVGAGVPQNVTVQTGTLTLPGTARTVPGNLSFTGGSASQSGGDLTVNGTLALGSSTITTGGSKVILPASGSLTRTSGYVAGNLQKNVATGSSVNRTFEIGDASNYSPVSVSFASVSGAGDLVAAATAPSSPPAPSNLSASKYVSRSWTLTNSGVAFTTYDATLNFVPGDIQGAGDPNKFVVAKNTSGTWSKPTVGTRTATSTQATGLAAFSDFAIGEPATYTITASAGANGSISPSGAVSVANGGSQAFMITPNGGYIVQDVLVDGGSVGAVTSYPFTNVGADHTISASFVADPNATVNAVSPGTFVTTVANATVPVTLTRGVTTPILGYSVTLQLSGLTTTSGAFSEGGFLSASGSNTTFQVVDNGGGSYTVDGVTLGTPCGSSATSGTLFSLAVGSTLTSGTGTVTITSLTLRDCSNNPLTSNIGTAASVSIDRSVPSVAVTSPNGGESWLAGSSHAITWTATDAEGIAANSIALEYSVDNGSSWLPVASGLANSGTFSWTVPANPSTTARVRATAVDIHANTGSDASDAAFTIQGTTSTSVSSAPNPSVVGESVTLTATVTPASASGTVEFFDGATSLGTAPLTAGNASVATSSLPVGSRSLTAVYAGSALHAGSTSAAHGHTVNPAATSTALNSAANPSVVGESVALTATVSVSPPGAGTPSGTVEFFDGATSLGTSPLVSGSAVLNTAALPVGARSLTAVFSGDASFGGSTSPVHGHTVNVASTSTALGSSPNPSVVGESVALTASVSVSPPGAGSPSGTVEFFDGATSLGTSPLVSGSAVLNTAAIAVGARSLTAVYSGDASFAGSTSPVHAHTVDQAATSTALTSAPNPSTLGSSVALTATVSVGPPASGTPTGSVEFFDGATSLGSSPVSSGSAVLNTSVLSAGSHSLTAVYSGDASFTGSTSAVHSHSVTNPSTSTAVTSSPNPSVVGESVTLTATVTPSSATGSVEWFDGPTSLGSSPLSGGVATKATSALALGSHSITAVYSGDLTYTTSTSPVHTHTVGQAATSTALNSAPNPSTFGGNVTLTATVSVTPPGAGSPSGSVEFFDGVTSLGTSPLVSGSAQVITSSLSAGGHSLTAVYSGDPSFAGSTSPAHSHTVNAASSNTSLASSQNPSTFGQSVTFTATVTPSTATGSVEFFDGSTSLGTSPVASGSAQLSTSALAAGSHPITAVYSGNSSYSGSTSNLVTQVVNAASSSVTLVAAPDPGVYQDPVTLTATVAPSGATGSVEFFDGVTSLGTQPVSAGSAQLITSSLVVGPHSLTAHYSGDGSYSGSTSTAYSLEVKAKIVATAGANGSLSPLGTTLYSLNATPSYTFSADPGYHVASVTVDGGAAPLTSPYTFAAVSSNHTIDVQFAVNPAVPAITTLAATQVRTGNDGDGNTKITLTWTAVPAGSTVEVWRKGYGNYPEYDDGPTPGSVPPTPGAYPPAGWTLTTVTSPGDTDEPGSRDFWYYVAYVTDTFGTRSPVSNQTTGTLSYHLGDVSDGTTPGLGDNKVSTSDLSALGAHYGIYGAPVDAVNFLDVGPTTDLSVTARPMTDNKINFEDLVLFAINYYPVASAPQAHATPAASSQDALVLTAPPSAHAGEDVAVRISFTGTGRALAMSAHLAWDPAVVQPVSFTAGDAVLEQGALLFSAAPGSVDGAVFTGTGQGFTGDGEFATLHFQVVAAGDPKFAFAGTDARDNQNHTVILATGVTAVTPKSFVTAFAPAMPNPFGRSTTFAFSLAKAGRADLEVFSVDGRRVRTITSGLRDAGEYRLEWNGADDSGHRIAPGVYYARLVTAQGRFTRVVTRLE